MRSCALFVAAAMVASCGTGADPGSTLSATAQATATTVPDTTSAPTTALTTTSAPTTTTSTLGYSTVQVGGINLAYECDGNGSPTVLMLHHIGRGGTEAYEPGLVIYRPMMDAIAEVTTVCFLGRPGMLGSDPPATTPQTVQEQVDVVSSFIDAAGIDTPVILAGHLWGGIIGLTASHQKPDQVGGLLLVNSLHPHQWEAFEEQPEEPYAPEFVDLTPGPASLDSIGSLGDLPMTIVTSVMDWTDYPDDVEVWAGLQAELAALSTNSVIETIQGPDLIFMVMEVDVIKAAVEDLVERMES